MVQVVESSAVLWTTTDDNGLFELDLKAPRTGQAITINVVVTIEPFFKRVTIKDNIVPTEEPVPIVDPVVATVSTASISLIALGVIGGTDIGRWKFFTLMIPLFTRIVKPKVLDHFERGRIYEHIRKNPGDSYSSIRKTLGLKNGALAHHLRILEMHEYIESRRDGMYKRFYPKGMKVPIGKHMSIQEQILGLIKDNPRITQKLMAEELSIDRSTVNYHVKILLAMGVIRSEKEGRVKYYYFIGVKDPVPYRA
jgi:predicted transcriptional regulator